jgi:hypothetical protein
LSERFGLHERRLPEEGDKMMTRRENYR